MDYDQYIIKMKELQNNLLKFIEEDESNGDSIFIKYLNENKISKSRLDLYHLIRLLLQIVNDYHRHPSFLDKIKQVFNYLKNDIKNIFTNIEIFNICKSSKLVLLYFIKNDFINLDDFIIKEMNKTFTSKSKIYFYPEIKNEFRDYNKKFREEYSFIIKDPNFDEKRELGENDSYICSLIRQDLIDEFIIYVNRTNLSLSSVINSSVFETNSFLQNKNISLIEYAAFFGSFQIFKYLQLNNVNLSPSLMLYAIHGKNAEIIHILEENVDDISYIDCFFKAIKCHHNDIAIYFLNTHLNREKSSFFALEFHNYAFFPENLQNINFSTFLEYVFKYDLVKIVDILINSKIIDVNKTLISMWYPLRVAFDKKSYEIVNLLLLQPELEIGNRFFVNHKNLEKITYNSNSFSLNTLNFKTHISTIRIGIEAFARCSFLTEVCLPSSVTIIEKNAFSESSIQSISILSNYIELKKGWCSNTPNLKKIYMNPDNKNYKFYDNKFILGKSSIESEKYDVIEFCLRNIENATIPNFIQLIEQYAFQFCINIQEIEFPKSLIKIEKYAFDNCKQLKKISIPSFVYSIGEYSFSKCLKLEQVTFPVARFFYNDNIFKKYSSLEKISITLSLFNIGEGAFEDCSSLKQIEIPSSITSIQDRVFNNCTSLMNVKMPSTLTSIGSLAFEKCINLTQINWD